MSPGSDTATVMVVDDEQEVADVYALRLRNEYETRVAYGGEDALETIDEDVDVLLLDRRMPDLSGDDVLERIEETEYDCRVLMLTAVDPGLDITDMPFDDYLCKPVEKDDLVEAIDQQLEIQRYDERLSEYLEVTSKLALLESELSAQEVEANGEVASLRKRAAELREKIADEFDEFDEIEATFREIGRHPG
ncbi:response regulator [Halobacteriales archaeon QH_10_65_19]|nr:MAG: response regulator [Halobacteriales archaeon QH_10_65_19]